jgi:RNA polymerase sigma-B factor
MAFDKQTQLDLFDRYRLHPSTQLRNQIAIANQGLVRDVAHRLLKQLSNVDYDDLFQVGFIGLIRSIERYDPLLSHSFSSYAVPFIRGNMLHYLRDKHNTVKVNRAISNFIVPVRKAIEKLTLELGRRPKDLEIANELKIDLSQWLEIKQAFYESNALTLNIVLEEEQGNRATELINFVVDKAEFDRSQLDEELTDIDGAIEQLNTNERRSIECYYLENMSRKDTAEKIGVSPITVTRCLVRGVQKLKALLNV